MGKVNTIVTNFIRILIVLALIGAYSKNRPLIMIFLILTFLATYIPRIMRKFFKIETRAETQVIMLIIIYAIFYLSEVRQFFNGNWWDNLLTFGASVILGFIGFTVVYVLYQEELIDISPFMIILLSFSLSFAIGGVWEIFEFSMDTYFGFSLQQIGTGNTITDLIIYALGSLMVSIGGYFYMKSPRNNILSSLILNFMNKNPRIFKSKKYIETSSEKLARLIQKGEGDKLEFKTTLRTNIHTGEIDKKIELSVLKTLAAYLNSEGGTLLIGVSDAGEVIGLEKDAFENNDKLNLHFANLVKQHIGRQYFQFIRYELFPLDDKHILKIDCLPSNRRVFLRDGKEEEFYVRNGPSTSRLTGSALIDYINHRFSK
ncbi:MAG: ATP-binding protein [Candidatus Pacearchaeota archaeon]|nr:ATP-binding protein [Candidatus Pacearchaeota archaeon]